MCWGPSGFGSAPAVRFPTTAVLAISQIVPVKAAGFAFATYTLPSEGSNTNAEGKSPRVTFPTTAEPEMTETLELSKLAT